MLVLKVKKKMCWCVAKSKQSDLCVLSLPTFTVLPHFWIIILICHFSATFFFSFDGDVLLFVNVTLLFRLVEGNTPDDHAALLFDWCLWLNLVSHWSVRSRPVPVWLFKFILLRIQLQLHIIFFLQQKTNNSWWWNIWVHATAPGGHRW